MVTGFARARRRMSVAAVAAAVTGLLVVSTAGPAVATDGAHGVSPVVASDHGAGEPTIEPSLTDAADGDRWLPWEGGAVIDTVRYANLEPGREYTLVGELRDRTTGARTGATGETVFTPTEPEGVVDVAFTVPEGRAGTSVVVFERLYDVYGLVVAVEDITIEAHTVSIEPSPTLTIMGGDPFPDVVHGTVGLVELVRLAFQIAEGQATCCSIQALSQG